MTAVTIQMDRPPYTEAEHAIRHTLRDLYGFLPPSLGSELASHIHIAVSEYQDRLLQDIGEAS